jgi:hypothetical protein
MVVDHKPVALFSEEYFYTILSENKVPGLYK